MSSRTTIGAALVLCGVLGAVGSAPASAPDRAVRLKPMDGGHWQGHAGLSDARGNASQALVRDVDGSDEHPEVAAITGFAGRDTSAIQRLGFTVASDDVTIIPCIRVAVVDALRAEREVMYTPATMTRQDGGEEGWTAYRVDDVDLPAGTIRTIEVGLHVIEDAAREISTVRFDDVVVNDSVFTQAGDNGSDPANARPGAGR